MKSKLAIAAIIMVMKMMMKTATILPNVNRNNKLNRRGHLKYVKVYVGIRFSESTVPIIMNANRKGARGFCECIPNKIGVKVVTKLMVSETAKVAIRWV